VPCCSKSGTPAFFTRTISEATSPVPGWRMPRWLSFPGSPPTLSEKMTGGSASSNFA
jgi:hypothetical protein